MAPVTATSDAVTIAAVIVAAVAAVIDAVAICAAIVAAAIDSSRRHRPARRSRHSSRRLSLNGGDVAVAHRLATRERNGESRDSRAKREP
jgi:hypothetical protein